MEPMATSGWLNGNSHSGIFDELSLETDHVTGREQAWADQTLEALFQKLDPPGPQDVERSVAEVPSPLPCISSGLEKGFGSINDWHASPWSTSAARDVFMGMENLAVDFSLPSQPSTGVLDLNVNHRYVTMSYSQSQQEHHSYVAPMTQAHADFQGFRCSAAEEPAPGGHGSLELPRQPIIAATNLSSQHEPSPAFRSCKTRQFNPESSQVLKTWLESHPFNLCPTKDERILLALQTGLTEKQVRTFFKNRRARAARKLDALAKDLETSREHSKLSSYLKKAAKPSSSMLGLENISRLSASSNESMERFLDEPLDADTLSAVRRQTPRTTPSTPQSGRPSTRARSVTSSARGSDTSKTSASSAGSSVRSFASGIQKRTSRKGRRRFTAPQVDVSNDNAGAWPCTVCPSTSQAKWQWRRREATHFSNIDSWQCSPDGSSLIDSRCLFCGARCERAADNCHECQLGVIKCRGESHTSRSFPRKDLLRQHFLHVHDYKPQPEWAARFNGLLNHWHRPVPAGRIDPLALYCGFCDGFQSDWNARCDDIAEHLGNGEAISSWRTPFWTCLSFLERASAVGTVREISEDCLCSIHWLTDESLQAHCLRYHRFNQCTGSAHMVFQSPTKFKEHLRSFHEVDFDNLHALLISSHYALKPSDIPPGFLPAPDMVQPNGSKRALLSRAQELACVGVPVGCDNISKGIQAYSQACSLLQLAAEQASIEEERVELSAMVSSKPGSGESVGFGAVKTKHLAAVYSVYAFFAYSIHANTYVYGE